MIIDTQVINIIVGYYPIESIFFKVGSTGREFKNVDRDFNASDCIDLKV